jgi:murein DD-endopeptidase MepM/ murein hydrolase activator NlpD
VVIDHGSGVFSGYHHLAEIMVTEGQEVAQGDVIGTVGDTGLSTAPHLHWEVIVQGTRVDPMPWTQAEIAP